jgi:hypothetical protein
VSAITAPELLATLRRIEARGRHETAYRVRAVAGRVFRYAVATGRAQHDVAADLKDALAPGRMLISMLRFTLIAMAAANTSARWASQTCRDC